MKAPIDVSKFRKTIAKSIPGLSEGFNDPKTWLSTGCYALNYLISGNFKGGIPLEGKFTMFAGDSGCLPRDAKITGQFTPKGEMKITRTITVEELRDIYHNGEVTIELQTPDGWQPVISWWDKGSLPMVQVSTTDGLVTRCATNHLLQRSNSEWVPAFDVKVGDALLTIHGQSIVQSVTALGEEECFDFEIGHENHRYYGDGFSSHNSGKSYIASANIVKDAQSKGIFPVLIDTENALDESWLHALDVDTSEDKLMKISGATVDDVTKLILAVIEGYIDDWGDKPYGERPGMIFIIDSLGMLVTPTQVAQAGAGSMVGDLGIKAKQITHMMRVVLAKIAQQPIGLVATNHVFAAQDKYSPDTIPGGKMLEFAASVLVQMNKYQLKEDENGVKLTDGQVAGIKTTAVLRKTRWSKAFEKIRLLIPHSTGMDPYSGLFDLFEKKGVIVKEGNRYSYTSPVTGEIVKDWRKNFKSLGYLDTIMEEWEHWEDDGLSSLDADGNTFENDDDGESE